MSSDIIGWILIGAACSLAGMMYPFRRGAAGVVLNFVAGGAGGLAWGLGGWVVAASSPHRRGWSMALAAAGALLILAVIHLAYSRRASLRPAQRRPARP